jgi:hypothetical protein
VSIFEDQAWQHLGFDPELNKALAFQPPVYEKYLDNTQPYVTKMRTALLKYIKAKNCIFLLKIPNAVDKIKKKT